MKEIKTVTVYSSAGVAAADTGSAVDLAPTATVAKRELKLIVAAQVLTAGTFNVAVTECDTTNGTFTAVAGDTITAVTTNGVREYTANVTKRYVKGAITTVAGTGAAVNAILLLQQHLREA